MEQGPRQRIEAWISRALHGVGARRRPNPAARAHHFDAWFFILT
jgi:hypothetical protein